MMESFSFCAQLLFRVCTPQEGVINLVAHLFLSSELACDGSRRRRNHHSGNPPPPSSLLFLIFVGGYTRNDVDGISDEGSNGEET